MHSTPVKKQAVGDYQ